MDREERRMLEETLALAKDSNRKVNKLYSSAQWSKFIKFIYLAVIIIAGVAAYMFVKPYVEQLGVIYGDARGQMESVNEVLDAIGGGKDTTDATDVEQ